MHFIVYNITNKLNSNHYIGAHKTEDLDDGYMGSGVIINRALKKYGIENFSKEIIFRAVSEPIMYWIERMLVDEEFVKSKETYNLKLGGDGGWDFVNKNCGNQGERLNKNLSSEKRSLGGNNAKAKRKLDVNFTSKWKILCKLKFTNGYEVYNKGTKLPLDSPIRQKMSEAHKGKGVGKDNSQYGTIWIYNAELQTKRKILPEQLEEFILLGWTKGMKPPKHQKIKDKNNPQFGKIWIRNVDQNISIIVSPDEIDEYLNNGWIKGRKMT